MKQEVQELQEDKESESESESDSYEERDWLEDYTEYDAMIDEFLDLNSDEEEESDMDINDLENLSLPELDEFIKEVKRRMEYGTQKFDLFKQLYAKKSNSDEQVTHEATPHEVNDEEESDFDINEFEDCSLWELHKMIKFMAAKLEKGTALINRAKELYAMKEQQESSKVSV